MHLVQKSEVSIDVIVFSGSFVRKKADLKTIMCTVASNYPLNPWN